MSYTTVFTDVTTPKGDAVSIGYNYINGMEVPNILRVEKCSLVRRSRVLSAFGAIVSAMKTFGGIIVSIV